MEGGGDRLVLEAYFLEADRARGGFQRGLRRGVARGIVVDEEDGPAQHDALDIAPGVCLRGALQVQQVAGDDVAEGHRAAGADVGVLLHQRRAEHALHRAHQAAVGAVDVGGDRGAAIELGQRVQVLALGDVEHGRRHRLAAFAVLRLERHELHAGAGGDGHGRVGGAEIDGAVVAGVGLGGAGAAGGVGGRDVGRHGNGDSRAKGA